MTIKSSTTQIRTELKDFKLHPITKVFMNIAVIIGAYILLFGIFTGFQITAQTDKLNKEIVILKKELAQYKPTTVTKPAVVLKQKTIMQDVQEVIEKHKFWVILGMFLCIPSLLILAQIFYFIYLTFTKGIMK